MKFKKSLKILTSLAFISPLSGSLLATAQIDTKILKPQYDLDALNQSQSRIMIPKPPVNLTPGKYLIQKKQLIENWVKAGNAFDMSAARIVRIRNLTQVMFHIQSTLPPTVINAFEYAFNKFNEQFNSSQLVLKYTISANPSTSNFRVVQYTNISGEKEPWMEAMNYTQGSDSSNIISSEIRVPSASFTLPQAALRSTAMHEILHSLGMNHAFPEAQHSIDMRSWTLMNDGNINYFNSSAVMMNPNAWQMTGYGDLDMEILKTVYINKIEYLPSSMIPTVDNTVAARETNEIVKKSAQYARLEAPERAYLAYTIDASPNYASDSFDRLGVWGDIAKNLMGVPSVAGQWYNPTSLKMTVNGAALTKGSQIRGNTYPIKVEYTLTPIGTTTKITDSFTLNS